MLVLVHSLSVYRWFILDCCGLLLNIRKIGIAMLKQREKIQLRCLHARDVLINILKWMRFEINFIKINMLATPQVYSGLFH